MGATGKGKKQEQEQSIESGRFNEVMSQTGWVEEQVLFQSIKIWKMMLFMFLTKDKTNNTQNR